MKKYRLQGKGRRETIVTDSEDEGKENKVMEGTYVTMYVIL